MSKGSVRSLIFYILSARGLRRHCGARLARWNRLECRDGEQRRICGERHFQDALGVDYKVVVSARELP